MNRLNDLIKELCPNGVSFFQIKEIAKVTIGEFVHKNKQSDDGLYPVYNGGTSNTGFYDEYNNDGHKVIISARGANAGFINRVEGKYWAGNSCYTININDETMLNWNYLYQFLKNNQATLLGVQQTGSIPAISKKQVEDFKIAIPPLEIQEEIVKVLDKFGELEAELEVELEAELEVRRSQYEFWRGKILNKSDRKYKKYNITEICTSIFAGGDVPPDTLKGITSPQDDYIYPVISNGVADNAIYGYSKNYRVDVPSCVTIAARGTIGYHEVRYGKFTPIIRLITLVPDEKIVTAEYLHYALYECEFISSGGSIPQLTTPTVKQLDLIIPPLEEQQRIVSILNRFDRLINDISVGIPAEIVLRKKQYEYYRNLLLNFEALDEKM